jgi:membrane-associated phospholipid phosphatase
MTTQKIMAPRVDGRPLRSNAFMDLRSPGLLAKWPLVGLSLFIFGSLAFGGLFYNLVSQGPLLAWDRALAANLPALGLNSPAFVRVIMQVGFYLGKEVILVLDLLLAVYFIYKRYWQEFAMVTIGWMVAAGVFYLLSTAIARPRPPTQIWIIVDIPGFPSGHAVSVIVFYGLLAYLIAPKMPSIFWKIVVVATALFFIGFVGFSRIFTGGHYLTDILAGYAVGIALFGGLYTLIEIYFQRRRSHDVKKE